MSEKKKFGGDEPRKGFSFSTEKVESVEAPAPVVEAPKEEPKAVAAPAPVAKEPAVLYGKAKLICSDGFFYGWLLFAIKLNAI